MSSTVRGERFDYVWVDEPAQPEADYEREVLTRFRAVTCRLRAATTITLRDIHELARARFNLRELRRTQGRRIIGYRVMYAPVPA